jgi:hypothetical protein
LLDKLHPEIVSGLEKNKFRNLNVSHAEQLSMIKNYEKQLKLAINIEDHSISVRELENMIHEDLFDNKSRKSRLPTISLWRKGREFYQMNDRIGMVCESTLNTIINNLGRKSKQIGRKAGRIRRESYLARVDRRSSKTDWVVGCFNEMSGWGRISINESKLTLEDSLIRNHSFLLGYLEGILGAKLELTNFSDKGFTFSIESSQSQKNFSTWLKDSID